jgi:hypothetical protein
MRLIRMSLGMTATSFAVMGCLSAQNLFAADYSLVDQLAAFRANPKAFMNDHQSVRKYLQHYAPTQTDQDELKFTYQSELREGEMGTAQPKFSPQSIQNRDFVDQKNLFHEGYGMPTKEVVASGRSQFQSDDLAEDLGGKLRETHLSVMDHKYKTGKVSTAPWSSDYWPTYQGSIARRYADPKFPESDKWSTTNTYILANLFIPGASPTASVDNLSPAEKYDFLMGDKNYTLTKSVLADGSDGMPTWEGICHGWAPAAFMEDRPKNTITVLAADDKTHIKFYPSDIKAILSQLWARTSFKTNFIGGRCNIKNPPTDPVSGRIIAQECFDTNPGTWHLAVVNQIGIKKKSFVFDATYDAEVWNQPAYSYEYTYFNPKTNQPTDNLKDATTALNDPAFKDIFHAYRNNPKAVSVVGISMKFVYVAETNPEGPDENGKLPKDKAELDRHVAVNYLYDVELDQDGNIVGGEWYHVQHPDFLWAPAGDSDEIQSIGDDFLKSIKDHSHWINRGHSPVPKNWQEAAAQSSQKQQPLAKVVRELDDKASATYIFGIPIHWPFNHSEQ